MSAAEKIKNFFKKKKTEAKFKVSWIILIHFLFSICKEIYKFLISLQLAGPGRRLDASDAAPSTSKPKSNSGAYIAPQRKELTSEAR